ncbi:restriction endonuclease subunit S [Staphylococcus haemolyticus]|uniref:restriction endonuclease subunit S n=1 Tax=Staphylococcus haemolyticus TaxID=1283 RepID=UPI001F0A3364|nr:restriction endonuclease subunit S [Staphylococcus haemolyticus]MCH4429185.1 restriction endonuclease subunit S [Staphylococcus haemolyticus]
MTEQINTPELRFPEFNTDWTTNQAKNLFTNVSDKKHDGDLLVLSATQDKGMVPRQDLDLEIKYDKKNLSNYKRTLPNDFIISLRSFQGGFELNTIEGIVSPAYTVLRGEEELVQPKFFKQYFKSIRFIKKLDSMIYGIRDGKSISYKEFSTFSINYPSILEQQKIGNFFSKLDRHIELEEEKLELLEQQKRGYMQKIFSQELQFKDKITNNFDNWSEFKIKDIFSKIESGNRLPKSNLLDGDIPYVIAQTTNNGVYMNISKDTLDYHGNNLKKFKKGSITISIDNPDAMFIQTHDFVTSNVMRVLYNEKLSIEAHTFILYSLRKLTQTYNWSVKFSGPIIMDSKIKLPVKLNTNDIDWNIVNKIGEFLTKLDFKIYQKTTKVELLKQRKQGLLQKMFI